MMLLILVTTTAWLSGKLKRRNDPKWWKINKFGKKKITKSIQGSSSKLLTLIFCCESDKAYDPTVTEVVKKLDSIVPIVLVVLNFRCYMEINSEFGRLQTTLPCEKIDSIPSTVPLPTTMN